MSGESPDYRSQQMLTQTHISSLTLFETEVREKLAKPVAAGNCAHKHKKAYLCHIVDFGRGDSWLLPFSKISFRLHHQHDTQC
jgi:hypothetical protein